ncbi:MAG: M81 family metallopeptidase, partial [Planctomycetaceae bacterium]|nr:M81 family metallopeptidase [Planctomycetaceae bacterium]
MRIAIGQLWQETNTFNPRPTTRRDFEEFGVLRGAELVEKMATTNELGAFIQSLRAWPEQPEIVGLVRLPAWPSGTATRKTYDWLEREMLAALDAAGPVDALLLALHGAMVAEGVPDVEGAILTAIRRRVGPQLPIVATLDLHTNITREMVEQTQTLVLFHTAPHIDVHETGLRGAAALRRILVDRATPTTAFIKLPVVFPAERANTQDRASISFQIRERLEHIEQQPQVITAGLATVQPWLDIPELGTAVIVTTAGDQPLADKIAQEIGDFVWEHREDYLPELTPLADAVREAHATSGLVVLSDSADATTSGAPGDSNQVLRELL